MKVGICIGERFSPETGGGDSYSYTLAKELLESSNNVIEYYILVQGLASSGIRQRFGDNKVLTLGYVFYFFKRLKNLVSKVPFTSFLFEAILEVIVERTTRIVLMRLKRKKKLISFFTLGNFSVLPQIFLQ